MTHKKQQPNNPPMGLVTPALFAVFYCALLFFFASGLRLLYCAEVLKQFAKLAPESQTSYQMGYLTLDSPEYLGLAAKLLEGRFADSVSLRRPVGYPAFLALTGMNPAAILSAQAILLAFIPVCTFILVILFTRNNLLGFAAGLVSCISPTGIAIASLVMSDALFSVLFSVLFTAMVYGALCNSFRWIAVSAFLSGVAILVKPVLLFWPIVSIVVCGLIIGSKRWHGLRDWLKPYLAKVIILFLVPLVFMISWAGANHAYNGIFTVSVIGGQTMREYLAIKAEEWGKAGHLPPDAAILENQTVVRKRFALLPDKEKVRAYSTESLAIFEKYPSATLRAFVDDVLINSTRGWNYFPRQLSYSQEKLGRYFGLVSSWEAKFRKLALVIIGLIPLISLAAMKVSPSPDNYTFSLALHAMALTIFSFVILSGGTFWTGPRIVYPTEIVQIASIATLSNMVARVVGRLCASIRGGF